MQIKVSENLSFLGADSHILGYVGETNSRTLTFNGLSCEGADYFKLRLEYADGVSYEVDITSGSYTVDGSVLRAPGKVKCQIMACKSDGEMYTLVKKSNVFELIVKQSLEGEPAPIPTYEQSKDMLDKLLAIGGGETTAEIETMTNADVEELLAAAQF